MINDNLLNADGTILESSLIETLNPSILGGVTKEGNETFYNTVKYSNGNGDTVSGGGSGGSSPVSPEMIQASIALTQGLISGIKNKKASQGTCKKPLLPESGLNRGKWTTYKDCLKAEEKAKERELALAQAKLEQQQRELELLNAQKGIADDEDKILGMPKVVAIGLGVLVLAIGGFVVYKKFIAKKN